MFSAKLVRLLAASTLALGMGAAQAAPLTGNVSFVGSYAPNVATGNPVSFEYLAGASGLAFTSPGAQGSLGGFAPASFSFASNWDFTSSGVTLIASPFSFKWSSVTERYTSGDVSVLRLMGTLGTGSDAVPGQLTITSNGGSFSGEFKAVPLPATLMLLGAGFLGAAVAARRRSI